jgi:hypothetical protein
LVPQTAPIASADNRRDFPGGWPGDPRNAFQASGRTPEEQATFAHVQTLLRQGPW